MSTSRLEDLLAEAIPKGVQINVRHVSTPPTRCDATFSAPPGQTPEITFCESHMLMVTVNRSQDPESTIVDDEVAILGVEVYIYSTDRLTTLFVAKADSTGYVYLSKSKSRDAVTSSTSSSSPPKVSLLRALTSTFISFLARSYQRPGVRLVLSLFARAQNQYLFPGSVDNKRKHVLDDRGLIKWWCRAADPVLREYVAEPKTPEERVREAGVVGPAATAYLLVPGCDQYETRAFFPPSARADGIPPRWRVSYPVNAICIHPEAPPRCLIPRFPDDPKARFLTDLDDELSEPSGAGDSESTQRESGHWRSVKSLDQFWEMMSFRQECSAGRLVGFLWLVISPPGVNDLKTSTSHCAAAAAETAATEAAEVQTTEIATATTSAEARFDDRTLSALSAPKNEPSTQPPMNGSATCRSAFFWPEIGRGEIILSETDYNLANDVLLEQDFETEELAMTATMVWIRKVASVADVLWWGNKVTGRKLEMDTVQQPSESSPTVTPGLIVRKRKKENEGFQSGSVDLEGNDTRDPDKASSAETVSKEGGVNILTATFIRKKKKT